MLILSFESVFSKPPTEVITELATSISLSQTSFLVAEATHPPSLPGSRWASRCNRPGTHLCGRPSPSRENNNTVKQVTPLQTPSLGQAPDLGHLFCAHGPTMWK